MDGHSRGVHVPYVDFADPLAPLPSGLLWYRQGKGLEMTGTIDVQAVLLGSSGIDPGVGGEVQCLHMVQCRS